MRAVTIHNELNELSRSCVLSRAVTFMRAVTSTTSCHDTQRARWNYWACRKYCVLTMMTGACRGMYRSSVRKWLHPKSVIPQGSHVPEDLPGAMHTLLTHEGRGQATADFIVPANLLPLYLACSVYVKSTKPHFQALKRCSHCTIPMGMGAGTGASLGARISMTNTGQAPSADAEFDANFAVVARSASTRPPFKHRHTQEHTFQHPKQIKDVFFPFRLLVFQPLLGAVRLHSLCSNTHKRIHMF